MKTDSITAPAGPPASLVRTRAPAKATYVSADEVERADAFALRYQVVCQHPSEVGVPGPDGALVIDCNAILFEDTAAAVQVALGAARRGVAVGLHARHFTPAFRPLLAEPLVAAAKTHRKVLRKLLRLTAVRNTVTAKQRSPQPIPEPGERP